MTTREQDPYFAIDLDDRCYCRGHGNDPNATVCAPHEQLGDALNALEVARPRITAAAPCPCWAEAHLHGGHCCFRPLSDLGGDAAPWLDDVLFEAIERDLLPYCHSEEDWATHVAALAAARVDGPSVDGPCPGVS